MYSCLWHVVHILHMLARTTHQWYGFSSQVPGVRLYLQCTVHCIVALQPNCHSHNVLVVSLLHGPDLA